MKSASLAFLAAAVIAGPVLAESAKHGSSWVGPAQPVPYSQLKAYQRATPLQRATRDWTARAEARTGAAKDASAVVHAPKPAAGRDIRRTSSVSGAPAGPVNPMPASETEPPV